MCPEGILRENKKQEFCSTGWGRYQCLLPLPLGYGPDVNRIAHLIFELLKIIFFLRERSPVCFTDRQRIRRRWNYSIFLFNRLLWSLGSTNDLDGQWQYCHHFEWLWYSWFDCCSFNLCWGNSWKEQRCFHLHDKLWSFGSSSRRKRSWQYSRLSKCSVIFAGYCPL